MLHSYFWQRLQGDEPPLLQLASVYEIAAGGRNSILDVALGPALARSMHCTGCVDQGTHWPASGRRLVHHTWRTWSRASCHYHHIWPGCCQGVVVLQLQLQLTAPRQYAQGWSVSWAAAAGCLEMVLPAVHALQLSVRLVLVLVLALVLLTLLLPQAVLQVLLSYAYAG